MQNNDDSDDHSDEAEGDSDGWVSCTSPRWIYAMDPAVFEVRRAIANLVRKFESGARGDENPETSEVLPYVAVADRIAKAADQVLHDVVAEALERGAKTREVGDQLGVSRAAVTNRFSRELSDRRVFEFSMEDHFSRYLWVSAFERGPDFPTFDESIEDTSIYYLKHSINNLERAFWIVVDARKNIPMEDVHHALANNIPLSGIVNYSPELAGARDRIEDTLMAMLKSQLVKWMADRSPQTTLLSCEDYNPAIYIWYGLFQANAGHWFLSRAVEAIESDDAKEYLAASWAAYEHLGYMLNAFTRPECLIFLGAAVQQHDPPNDSEQPPA